MKIFLAVLLICGLSLAQNQYDGTDEIWEDYSRWISSDSVFFENDTVWIAEAETLEVFIGTRQTLGMIRLHGTVTALDSVELVRHDQGWNVAYSGGDTVRFYLARHMGDGSGRKTDEAETYYAMDSVKIASGYGAFDFSPMDNATLQDEATAFYTLRIIGTAGNAGGIFIRIDYINAYKIRPF